MEYLSSEHPNIKSSTVKEEDGFLSFLDCLSFLVKFVIDVYRRKDLQQVYANFKSFIPKTYKIGLIKSL